MVHYRQSLTQPVSQSERDPDPCIFTAPVLCITFLLLFPLRFLFGNFHLTNWFRSWCSTIWFGVLVCTTLAQWFGSNYPVPDNFNFVQSSGPLDPKLIYERYIERGSSMFWIIIVFSSFLKRMVKKISAFLYSCFVVFSQRFVFDEPTFPSTYRVLGEKYVCSPDPGQKLWLEKGKVFSSFSQGKVFLWLMVLGFNDGWVVVVLGPGTRVMSQRELAGQETLSYWS